MSKRSRRRNRAPSVASRPAIQPRVPLPSLAEPRKANLIGWYRELDVSEKVVSIVAGIVSVAVAAAGCFTLLDRPGQAEPLHGTPDVGATTVDTLAQKVSAVESL